jgi:N-acyl homoserine lactone hydrolase
MRPARLIGLRISDLLAKEKAELWINHDKAQRDTLKMAPTYYE